jgi:hypothetical protein
MPLATFEEKNVSEAMRFRLRLILNLFACTVLFSGGAAAQALKVTGNPETFVAEVQSILKSSTNPNAGRLGTDLESVWNGSQLGEEQRQQLLQIGKYLSSKNYRAPYFYPLAEAVTQALLQQNARDELATFLTTTQQFLPTTDGKTAQRYLEFARQFISNRLLYYSPTHQWFAPGGTYVFRFAKDPTILNAPPAPVIDSTKLAKAEPVEPAEAEATDDGWGNSTWNDGWGEPVAQPFEEWKNEPEPVKLGAGVILELKGVNLFLATAHDSVSFPNLTATVGFKEGLLYGSDTKFEWEVADLAKATANLKIVKILLKSPRVLAEDATLTYADRLEKPVQGVFRFESKKRAPNAPLTQPQFLSADNDAVLKNLGPGVAYQGGFALIGRRLFSTAANGEQATITYSKADKPIFRLRSPRFELGDSVITSPQTRFVGYLATGDSITHPAVRLWFDPRMAFVRTNRLEKGGFRTTPYTDTYHALDIQADAMRWNAGTGTVDFYTIAGQTEVPVRLESFDYYEAVGYSALAGGLGFHPLNLLNAYLRDQGRTKTLVTDFAAAYPRLTKSIREGITVLWQRGLVNYDPDTDEVKLTTKGKHYLGAAQNRKDFDNLVILSTYASSARDSTANVRINLADNQMLIRGARRFSVSDSLKIFVTPRDGDVRMGKNRDFVFNGEMKVDNYRFKGQNVAFNYDKFFVSLDKIDSVTFVPQQAKGKQNVPEVGGDLKYSQGGTLYLGKAGNKSGKTANPPRLVIPGGSNVYFDQVERLGGVYNRNVYFKIPKIDQDSLTSRDIAYVGTFHSDGMFPPIQTKLVTMPDNSLGFEHKTPAGGYPLFGGSAKFTGTLRMDGQGLHAEGEFVHLTTGLTSKALLFTPDSVVAEGTAGQIRAGTVGKASFPAVVLKDYAMKWRPKQDSLTISTTGRTFDFYGGSTQLEGTLVVRSTGLYGQGTLKRKDAEIVSDALNFSKDQFGAERASIKIGTGEKPFLLGTAMDVAFNVAAGNARIQTPKSAGLADSSSLTLPYANYKTSINQADWNVAAKTITMKGDVNTSTFTSLAPDQEGLRFRGSEAVYDIPKMTLNVKGVPYLTSADAKIIPDKGLVSIKQDGELLPFTKARIIADTLNEYHRLADANVRVLSKSRFEGQAVYRFARAAGDTVSIKMEAFEFTESGTATATASTSNRRTKNTDATVPAKSVSTLARATIDESQKFLLSPRMRYRGDVTMKSGEPNLLFNGFVQPVLKSRKEEAAWIAFQSTGAESVNIVVDSKLQGEGQPLFVGLHHRANAAGLYTSFLTPKETPSDGDIFVANGKLIDVPKTSRFDVLTDAKAAGEVLEGSRYSLDDARNVITYDGPLRFFQPAEYVQAAGVARIVPDSAKYQFSTLLVLNFPIPAPALAAMGDKIVKTNIDEKPDPAIEADEAVVERLTTNLANVIGQQAGAAYRDKAAGGYLPLGQAGGNLATALVTFTNVNWRYSEEHSAFYSAGKLGVASLGPTDVNAELTGMIEIRKTPTGDELSAYLEASPDVWYYVGFAGNQLGVVSSDNEFNSQLTGKGGKTKDGYAVIPVGEDEKVQFTERFATVYKTKGKTKPLIAKPTPGTPAPKQPATAETELKPKKAEEKKTGF